MALTKVPSNLDATIATTQSQADNSTNIATTAYVDLAVSSLSDSAPAALNTLNEIAAALGDDANYASTTTAAIAAKLPLSGGAMTGAITTNSTFDGVDIAVRDAILTSTTTTANAALPLAGGTMSGDLNLAVTDKVDFGGGIGEYASSPAAGIVGFTSRGSVGLFTDSNNNGSATGDALVVYDGAEYGGSTKTLLKVTKGNDISFYEDTGTTAKLLWDASDERLNLTGSDYQFGIKQGSNQPWYLRSVSDGSFRLHLNGTSDILVATSGGVNVTGYMDADNFKINGAQGSDGQVLTSTGSGVAWEAIASTFADLSDVTVSTSAPTITTNPSTGVGTLWLDKTLAELYVCTDATSNVNTWKNIGDGTGAIEFSSSGGTKVTTGGYVYHTFTSSGNFVFSGSKSAQALIIAGGGGGGGQAANGGGGGGAGGLVYASSINLTSQTYAVTVGAGGVAGGTSGGNGGNSSFPGETVAVGGGGGGTMGSAGNSGGSGGGGGRDSGNASGGAATSGQGNAGGVSINSCGSAGGGGGAGQAGIAGAYDCNNMNATQSDGGDGVNTYSAWATATSTGVGGYYAGGGAGAVEAQTHLYGRNEGGLGGGGIGSMSYDNHGTAGTANTGSGGGGGQTFQSVQRNAGAGGSGLVIIRYAV